MGNTSSQPDLSQRERLQSSKKDLSAQESIHGFGSLGRQEVRREGVPETQVLAEQADDIAASSQLLEESLRGMRDGNGNENAVGGGGGGDGDGGHGYGYGYGDGAGEAVTEGQRRAKRKRERGNERDGEENSKKKPKRRTEDAEIADSMEEHAMDVHVVTGELPAHLTANGTSNRKIRRDKSTDMVDGDGERDDWMLQLDGAAERTVKNSVQSTGVESDSAKKGGREKGKSSLSQNMDSAAAETVDPKKSEKELSAEASTNQRNVDAGRGEENGVLKESSKKARNERRKHALSHGTEDAAAEGSSALRFENRRNAQSRTSQGNVDAARADENGVLASPMTSNDISVSSLKGTGRKVCYVRIPEVRPAENGKASASGDALPTPTHGSIEEGAIGVAHESARAQSGSKSKKDKRDKKPKKLETNAPPLDAYPQNSASTHPGVALRSPTQERRGLTPKWTAVNQHMPTVFKSTVQKSHVNQGIGTQKHDMSSPTSKPSMPAEKPRIPAVAATRRKAVKEKKSPKSKEFISDSDLSDTEEPSKMGVLKDPKKAHAVTPQQVQNVVSSKKESKKRKKSHRMANDEGRLITNEAKNIDLADGSEDMVDDAAKSTPTSNRKRKRIPEEDDDQYALPPDSDDEAPKTAQSESAKRASLNPASRKSNQGKAEDTDDASPEKVKGAFSPSEISILTRHFSAYKTEHSLDQRSMNEMIQNTERSSSTKAFWDEIANLLPNRPRKSLQRFCRRQWHNYQSSGIWSIEEDEILRETYAFRPNKWVYIGGVVGRRPEDCRDRWRNVVKLGERRREGGWTEEEEQRLSRAVEQCAKAMMEARRESGAKDATADAEDMELLDWNVVSDKMCGTRSRQQCADKWKRMMRDAETTSTAAAADVESPRKSKSRSAGWRKERARRRYKKMLAGDIYDILKAVGKSGTLDVNNIRWSIVREVLGGRECIWEKADLEYAFSVIKRKAGLDGQEEKLGLRRMVKKMKRYLKGKFGKEAARRRFEDTEEGRRVRKRGWSAKTLKKRKRVGEKRQRSNDDDVDGVAQNEVAQDDEVQDEDVDDRRGLYDQDDLDGQEVDEQEVDGQEVAEQDVLAQDVDSVLSADEYT